MYGDDVVVCPTPEKLRENLDEFLRIPEVVELLELTAVDPPARMPDGARQTPDVTVGWPQLQARPVVSVGRLSVTGEHVIGRDDLLRQLDMWWDDPDVNVVVITGIGGIGKTTLVNAWLARIAEDYRKAERVYCWSFEGTTGEGSPDEFFRAATEWFGGGARVTELPVSRGLDLARLVRANRTLLVLDGLEHLQEPHGPDAGTIKDLGVRILLRELVAQNPGMCVITSRLPVPDLGHFAEKFARSLAVDALTPHEAIKLLRSLGVRGDDEPLRKLVVDYAGHPLSLMVLAARIRDTADGDVTRLPESWQVGPPESESRFYDVMASYEKRYSGRTELCVLRTLSLFDGPTSLAQLVPLRSPPIAGLTDAGSDSGRDDWNLAVLRLRQVQLLTTDAMVVSMHPLVREYFRVQVRRDHPAAWQEAHDRLFTAAALSPSKPESLDELAPTLRAVVHGCHAGRYTEALSLYKNRCRHTELQPPSKAPLVWRLGAFASELEVFSHFFHSPWDHLVASLHRDDQGYVLNGVGVSLRSSGRLPEAVEPIRAAVQLRKVAGNLESVVINLYHLSQLYMILGSLPVALGHAEEGIKSDQERLSEVTPADNWSVEIRAVRASVLHQMGRWNEAEHEFQQAERFQAERPQAKSAHLYAVPGYLYWDFLIDRGRFDEAQTQAHLALAAGETLGNSPRSKGITRLMIGKATLMKEVRTRVPSTVKSLTIIDDAIADLRSARQLDFLASGLITLARCRSTVGDEKGAEKALGEAEHYATIGPMSLLLIDIAIERIRGKLQRFEQKERSGRRMGKTRVARSLGQDLEEIRAQVRRIGYHRREQELQALGEQLQRPG